MNTFKELFTSKTKISKLAHLGLEDVFFIIIIIHFA